LTRQRESDRMELRQASILIEVRFSF
jgi:hypothetical protein